MGKAILFIPFNGPHPEAIMDYLRDAYLAPTNVAHVNELLSVTVAEIPPVYVLELACERWGLPWIATRVTRTDVVFFDGPKRKAIAAGEYPAPSIPTS